MTAALDKLTAHYERLGKRALAVDLGGGERLEFYATPPTAREAAQVQARAKGNPARLSLFTVIYMAKDASGARLFQDDAATVAALENGVAAEVIADMAAQIMDVSEVAELGE
jgi:hypothetical protein